MIPPMPPQASDLREFPGRLSPAALEFAAILGRLLCQECLQRQTRDKPDTLLINKGTTEIAVAAVGEDAPRSFPPRS